MERIVNAEFAELIISYVHFLTGTDPIYAGLHDYIELDEVDGLEIEEGESYRNIPHVVYPCHQFVLPKSLRHTTVVLPKIIYPWMVVHELGHVLDEALDYSHLALPITDYAKVNNAEAFAEALVGWLFEDSGEPDEETRCLFEYLAWG